MSWELGLMAASLIVAIIVAIIGFIRFRKRVNGWKRFGLSGSIPMWLVARAYDEWYSDRENLPRRELIVKGSYYIYKVTSKDKDVMEGHARVSNMVVCRKVRDDKWAK